MNDVERKISAHQERMKRLEEGEKMRCPFCRRGEIKSVDKYIIKCDTCGKAIVPRIKLNNNN